MKMIFVLATLTVASTSLINNFDYQILSAPVTYGRVADRIIDFKYFQITIEKTTIMPSAPRKWKDVHLSMKAQAHNETINNLRYLRSENIELSFWHSELKMVDLLSTWSSKRHLCRGSIANYLSALTWTNRIQKISGLYHTMCSPQRWATHISINAL